MTQTTARITKQGKHFEILVDLEEALKVKKGEGNISSAVLTDSVFHNLKSGEHVSEDELENNFETSVFYEVCEKIIKQGEVVLPTEFKNEELEKKYKQVVDFVVKNAVSPEGRPYTPDRIMKSLHEAHVTVKNKPIDTQIGEIIDALSKVLPIKLEMKSIRIVVPAMHTGKAYGILKENLVKEEWLGNGDLKVVVKLPAGIVMDFYDKLNGVTHGSAMTEEVKE